ncbi:MAG: NADH-quinone oxidoreductase subunit N, partial [Anaerolineales bacterium]|nr:NADH-quinone oxidoreductase subunit N [Anaerolineales bacterium]
MDVSILNDPNFKAILPELSLLILIAIVFFSDLLWLRDRKRSLGWLTAGGLALIAIILLAFGQPTNESVEMWGGMLRFDWLGFVFALLFIAGGAATALFAMDIPELQRGEFYVLLLTSIMGMSLMAASADLIMLFLAIETTSIPLYVLAGFFREDDKSTESGFKYLLFGAMASAVMLYGFSLLYGFTGTSDIYQISRGLLAGGFNDMTMIAALLLIMVGLGFKISAVPFHFWAPDVYEGSPTPVAGFLSTASKAAGFAVVIRVLLIAFPTTIAPSWVAIVAAMSTATMILGNTLALAQKNIKRLLAYSSIAHAGYVLLGVVAATELGVTSVVFYLIAYTLTNLAAFGVVAIVGRAVGSDDIAAYAGLSRRASGLSLVLLVALLSLAGVPPLAGFDAAAHAGYVLTLVDEGRLPHPHEGWSTFHPP